MGILNRFRPNNDRPDPQLLKETKDLKLAKYAAIKRFARLTNDRELLNFTKEREERVVKMLDDEYKIISSLREGQ